jgi:hypothetical protein
MLVQRNHERDYTKAPAAPDAGVIGDARGRQLRRRRRIALAAVALLGAGVLLGWATGWFGGGSHRTGANGNLAAFQRAKRERRLLGARISPALEGGSEGWAIVESNGAGCCTLPQENAGGGDIGAFAGWTVNSHEESATALLASRVAGIVVRGRRAHIVTLARLPYELRIAQIRFRRHAQPLFGEDGPAVVALDAHSKPIGYLTQPEGGVDPGIRWWQKPQPRAHGPCQLAAHGVPGLEPEWGHVAATIRPYPRKILGRAFFSCIDTEYYLHRWPLETAILLDAQHPGRTPAPIPRMKPLAGALSVFEAPGDWHGELVAERHGNAWLVVAGGSGVAQRLDVLRHLTATVSIRPH